MARTFRSVAITTAETTLFTAGSAADGNPLRVVELKNRATSSDIMLVQVGPVLHGAAEWYELDVGEFRQFASHNGPRGLIAFVKVKMLSGTGIVAGGAVDGN